MKTDNNPSIIFGLYSKPEKKAELLEQLKKLNVGVRELSLIDVEIPLDRKDEVVNFFKHFSNCNYWANRNPLLKDNFILNQIKSQFRKQNFIPIQFKKGDWIPDNKHSLLWALPVPLFLEDTSIYCTSEEEKKAFKELETFTSKGYKPIIDGEIDPKDMEMLE